MKLYLAPGLMATAHGPTGAGDVLFGIGIDHKYVFEFRFVCK
jgi:hypothetical protein